MKKTVCLETTIPSYYFEEREELKYQKEITKKWWDTQRQYFIVYISEMAITELRFGNYPNKSNILDLIKDIPTLSIPDEIRDIVEVYLKNYVMPRKDIGDAFHLAIASYYKIDYLLTWNCDHEELMGQFDFDAEKIFRMLKEEEKKDKDKIVSQIAIKSLEEVDVK